MCLGKRETQNLIQSAPWRALPVYDRDKAQHVKGLGPPSIKTHLESSDTDSVGAIYVKLLDCPPVPLPRPNPPLFYQCFGKSNSCHVHEVFSFLHPDSFRRTSHSSRRPVTLELCAGCGIFAVGLKAAGMDVRYAVEVEPIAVATYRANSPNTTVFQELVEDFLENAKSGDAGYPQRGDVDHIHSSSPCQTFSRKNRGPGDTENDKINIAVFFIIVHFVEFYLPKVVSNENVTGLLVKKHREHLRKLVRTLIEMGYSVVVFTVDASRYGDPQERERLIIFASRIDHCLPQAPPPTHGSEPGLKPFVTAKEGIGDLECVEPSVGCRRVPTSDGKKSLLVHWKDDRKRPQSDDDVMQLRSDRPAQTVLRRNYIEHYSGKRPLSTQERARLMGMDDSFQFFGSRTQVSDMIGNGVPVNLSKALGESIRDSFFYAPMEEQVNDFARNILKEWDATL